MSLLFQTVLHTPNISSGGQFSLPAFPACHIRSYLLRKLGTSGPLVLCPASRSCHTLPDSPVPPLQLPGLDPRHLAPVYKADGLQCLRAVEHVGHLLVDKGPRLALCQRRGAHQHPAHLEHRLGQLRALLRALTQDLLRPPAAPRSCGACHCHSYNQSSMLIGVPTVPTLSPLPVARKNSPGMGNIHRNIR